MALLAHGLLPASFRGAPFAVLNEEIAGGRRIALHQYPGKDDPWAEDMGRDVRRYRFRGFIVDNDVLFFGGPVQLQRALLIAALEKAGPGTLTHPTLGILNVSAARFNVGEDLGASRMSSVDVEFVESGKRTFPSLLTNSSGLLTASNLVKVGLAIDGIRLVALAAGAGGSRRDLSVTASTASSKAVDIGTDATALHRLAAQLPGEFGRFAGGGNAGLSGQRASSYSAYTTIADLVSAASAARSAITDAAFALADAAAGADLGYAEVLPDAMTALIDALDADRDAADRANIAAEIVRQAGPIPVTVTVELKGDVPAGTRTTVIAGHSKRPAISQAMQH